MFKSLLRKRDITSERDRAKSSLNVKSVLDTTLLDSTAKDMSLYYHPDFRSPPPPGQYETVYSPEEDKKREKGFVLRLKTKFGKGVND